MVNIKTEEMMDERMEINVLDYRLKVMTFDKSAISDFTRPLLDVIFFKHYLDNNNCKDNHGFVSVTQTDEDFTIIMEEEALKSLKINSKDVKKLKINEATWLPLFASAGASQNTSGISKIANSVLIPLADQGLSVYPLSAYKTDYVLIQEADFNKVCEVLAQNFRITREGVLDSREIIIDPSKIRKTSPMGANISRPVTHSFDCSNGAIYCMTSMDRLSLKHEVLTILDLLFFPLEQPEVEKTDSCRWFFNFSIIDQDITITVDTRLLNRFPPKILFNFTEYWRLIRIGDMPEGLGFREAGIVAQISEPIASAQISEYYISSFYYGHALVPVEHFDKVKNLLEQKRQKQKALQTLTQLE